MLLALLAMLCFGTPELEIERERAYAAAAASRSRAIAHVPPKFGQKDKAILPEKTGKAVAGAPVTAKPVHYHKCPNPRCGAVWAHTDDSLGNVRDHSCPACGRVQWNPMASPPVAVQNSSCPGGVCPRY